MLSGLFEFPIANKATKPCFLVIYVRITDRLLTFFDFLASYFLTPKPSRSLYLSLYALRAIENMREMQPNSYNVLDRSDFSQQ